MTDPRTALTPDQVREAALADFAFLYNQLRARYRFADYAAGLRLLAAIGEAAEAADHHPDLHLTYSELLVSLRSHDVHAVTSRDVEMARAVEGIAREHGATADTSRLTNLDLALDTARGDEMGAFYAALLGVEELDGEPFDPTGQAPTMWWQQPRDGDPEAPGTPLPAPGVPQRFHLDVWVDEDEGPRRVDAVLKAGGRLVSDAEAPAFWVVEDADGNRSCICTARGRDVV